MRTLQELEQEYQKLDEALQICIDRGDYSWGSTHSLHQRLNELDELIWQLNEMREIG